MPTASEITRLTNARNDLRNKGVALGFVLDTDNLTQIATKYNTALENQGAVSISVMEGETKTIPQGYHNGSGTVTGVSGGGDYDLQAKTVTPTKSQINITPDEGYFGISSVTVEPIPAAYQDVSSVTATAADILATKTFVPSNGVLETGTMPNNGAVTATIDGLSTTSYTIPAGFHNGAGAINLTNDIEMALAAI